MNTRKAPSWLAISLLLSACADAQDPAESEIEGDANVSLPNVELQTGSSPTVDGDLAPTKGPSPGGKSLGPGIQRLVDLAIRDLSARLGVAESSIEVIDAGFVTWRDSALGCSEPGYEYMQVLTNGSKIVLSVEKREYHYHSGANRPPFWCKSPDAVEPLPYAPGEA
jgi:hypothetical protein